MAITICPESQPLPGEMRVNTTLERTEVYDGRKWVELAIASSSFPMPGGSVALPRHSDLSTGITSIGIGEIGATSAISSLSASAVRDGVLPKTLFNTTPIIRMSALDLMLSELSETQMTDRVRLQIQEYVAENMNGCSTCFHLKFQEEKSASDDSLRCAATCQHKGAEAGCTTIICPDGKLSAMYPNGKRKAEFIELGNAKKNATDTQKEEVEPEPYIRNDPDRPATSDVDAW